MSIAGFACASALLMQPRMSQYFMPRSLIQNPITDCSILLRDVFVRLGDKARRADGEENQVVLARIADALWRGAGDEHHVTRPHVLGGARSDLDPPLSFQDDVALDRILHAVPARGHARRHAG